MERPTPTSRHGILAAVVVLVALSGCTGLGAGNGCGPGDTNIGDIESGSTEQVTVEGTVQKTGPGSYVIDDGTGKALIMSGQHDVSEEECKQITGTPTADFESQVADVAIAPST